MLAVAVADQLAAEVSMKSGLRDRKNVLNLIDFTASDGLSQ